jgi:hypothetical protein
MNLNLKRLIPVSIILISIVTTACKKGESDPFFSLRTRKNRVVGEWTLESGTYRNTEQDIGAPMTESIEFSSNGYTYLVDGIGYVAGAKGPYYRKLTFTKEGRVRIVESIDNLLLTTEGTWDFNSGVGKEKNKEQIIINVQSFSNSSGKKTYLGNQKYLTYSIKELRNKKMVLYYKEGVINPDGSKQDIVETLELKSEAK